MGTRTRMAAAAIGVSSWAWLGAPPPAMAQGATDQRVWTTTTIQGRIGDDDNWRWTADSIVRSRDGTRTIDFLAERVMITRTLTPQVSAAFGYAYGAGFPDSGSLREHRFVQQIAWSGGGRTRVSLKTRVEERFITGRPRLLRLRQQVRIAWPIFGGRLLAVVWEELFVQTNASAPGTVVFDSNRAFVGIGRKVTPRTVVEVGYLNVYSHLGPNRHLRSHVLSVAWSLSL